MANVLWIRRLGDLPAAQHASGHPPTGRAADHGIARGRRAGGTADRAATPTVPVDSARPELDSITIDDEAAGNLVGRHLIERGRQTIACVSEPQRSNAYLSQGQRRRAGLRRAAAEAGLDARSVREVKTTNDIEGGRAALRTMLAHGDLPEAIFATRTSSRPVS
jgi:DNA-binding LacI/PurR family transcriptional regulator